MKDRSFFDALIRMTDFLESSFSEEGFLPSEVALAEQFGVSRRTIRAVLAELAGNGYITTIPSKGHLVQAKRYRIEKIGVVLGEGTESPFLHYGGVLQGVLQPGACRRDVIFPEGPWQDETGAVLTGGSTLSVDAPRERLP